jgi:phospholipid/cholesterol/gamma-HCH transport system ATP-binding protein
MIEYIDIHKAFDAPVLTGVNLTVGTGETVAIVGPSGTGKSVLLKTTNGLLVPDRGDVRVDGESAYFDGEEALVRIRARVGYVFQYAALFDSMTVHENICAGLPEDIDNRSPECLAKVVEALEDVNLDPEQVLGKLPAELSGGMRKRVGLARSIVARPQILLYDEPVTGLDPVNTAAVSRLIRDIRDRTQVTSIIVTHDIEQALEISDRLALLEHGVLRFVGTPAEFKASDDPVVKAFADRRMAAEAAVRIMEEDAEDLKKDMEDTQ